MTKDEIATEIRVYCGGDMTGAVTGQDEAAEVIMELVEEAMAEATKEARRRQHQQDVEWLEDTLSPRREIPFNDGYYWDRTIRDKDCEHFKDMKIE